MIVHFHLADYLEIEFQSSVMGSEKKIILVTGGSGLVGQAIKQAKQQDPRENETFIFLTSKDGDLK